jgi:tetratricopeptide (TPR) repeat protein
MEHLGRQAGYNLRIFLKKEGESVARRISNVMSVASTVLISILLGLLANIATGGQLPPSVAKYGRFAWLALVVSAIVAIAVGVLHERRGRHASRYSGRNQAPAQLPPDIADFTGRRAERLYLRREILRASQSANVRRVFLLVGKPGVGKSALAHHVAHEVERAFPDGQLYAQLDSREQGRLLRAMNHFLRSLGIPARDLPENLTDASSLYRTALAGKRVLIILEDANDEHHARPFIPTGHSVLIVTSRRRLSGLESADTTVLPELSAEDSLHLLRRVLRIGAPIAQAPLEDIARYCGYLPLALRLVGARMAGRPIATINVVKERLAQESSRLDELGIADRGVRSAFVIGYKELGARERLGLCLLSAFPGSAFKAWVASVVLDDSDGEAVVERLTATHLLDEAADTNGTAVHYRFHDLVRLFAQERLSSEVEAPQRTAAIMRCLDAYVTLATVAEERLAAGGSESIRSAVASRLSASLERIREHVTSDAARWFSEEHENLVSLVELAYRERHWRHAWHLADALAAYLEIRPYWSSWEELLGLARSAAEEIGDPILDAQTNLRLAAVYRGRGRLGLAAEHCTLAYRGFADAGDRVGEAHATRLNGLTLWSLGRLSASIDAHGKALEAYRRVGHLRGAAHALRNRAVARRDLGDATGAREDLGEAITIYEALGERRWLAYADLYLGVCAMDEGKLNEALSLLMRSRRLLALIGDRRGEADALRMTGAAQTMRRRYRAAERRLSESLAICDELLDERNKGYVCFRYGVLDGSRQRHAAAARHFRVALKIFRNFEQGFWELRTLENMAGTLFALGEFNEAAEFQQLSTSRRASLGIGSRPDAI